MTIAKNKYTIRNNGGRACRIWLMALFAVICLGWPLGVFAEDNEGPGNHDNKTDKTVADDDPKPINRSPTDNDEQSKIKFERSNLDSLLNDLPAETDLSPGDRQLSEKSESSPSVFLNVLSRELETSRQVEELGSRIIRLVELDRIRKREQQLLAAERQVQTSIGQTGDQTTPSPNDLEESRPPIPDNDLNQPEQITDSGLRPDQLRATQILKTPPDQLALADNLFFSGEIELALELYQNLANQLTGESQKTWASFQIACCLRRIGRIDEASKLLREIAEKPESDPIVVNSRWWLDAIGRKKHLKQSLATTKDFIESQKQEKANETK